MPPEPRSPLCLALLLAGALAGCTGEGSGPVIGLPPPEAPPSGSSALETLLTPQDVVIGSPTEVYTRIARGVLTCWFGASGPLKQSYIYHAEAQPASRGGNSEIKIMTRDADAEDPRALRAYRVLISPSQGKTKVEIENVRVPEPLAVRLKQDVERWSRDEAGCGEAPVTAGWTAEPAAQADTKPRKDKKEKNKSP